MTRLLVSVRNAVEADRACRGGAALIDVKEPALGSLGAASGETIAAVQCAVAGRAPISAALGELLELDSHQSHPALTTGIAWAKLGLAGCARHDDWPHRWRQALACFPSRVTPVAVAYADWCTAAAPAPRDVLEVGAKLGCGALLVDTSDKSRGTLLELLSGEELAALIVAARERGLLVVLAGSLRREQVATLLPLAPDYLAVRGAVCRGPRTGELCEELVAEWSALLQDATASA
jgi:(5-formylfuran-3-yl)methyl phosphate synthase